MKDYIGKTVYLGIDVHKKTYSVTAMSEKIVIKKATIEASPEGLVQFCKKYFPGADIKSAYEAGFSGFQLHRILVKNGIDNIVVHAASVEVSSRDKVKTDKRDSLKLAAHLSDGRLKGIYVPSEEREAKRAVTRIRETMVRHRTSVAAQIKALLYQHGLISAKDKNRVSVKWIESLGHLSMSEEIRYALDHLTELWKHITIKVKEIDARMKQQAIEDNELERVYRSVPGIGPVGARVLANELEACAHFANEKQLFSYTGLTPSEHSSGGHIRKGHISRQGKTIIRKLMVLAAWRAIKQDSSLGKAFDRIAQTAGKKRAIVAIARRLVGRIRACFKNNNVYRTEWTELLAA